MRYQPTDQPTNRPTGTAYYRDARTHLKRWRKKGRLNDSNKKIERNDKNERRKAMRRNVMTSKVATKNGESYEQPFHGRSSKHNFLDWLSFLGVVRLTSFMGLMEVDLWERGALHASLSRREPSISFLPFPFLDCCAMSFSLHPHKIRNKAEYTAIFIACGWARGVELYGTGGQEQWSFYNIIFCCMAIKSLSR